MAYGCTTTGACVSAQFLNWGGDGRHSRTSPHILPRQEVIPNPKPRAIDYQHSSSLPILSPLVKRESTVVPSAVSSQSQQEKGKDKEIVQLPISVDYIVSPSNAYIKHLVRLRQNPKARSATASVLVVGTVPLREICEAAETAEQRRRTRGLINPLMIDVLFVREDVISSEEMARVSRRIVRVSPDAMSKLAGLDSPPELAGVLGFPPTFTAFQPFRQNPSVRDGDQMRQWCCNPKPRRILVLDSIQDPGNMGTLLRTAAAFAWDGVFLLPGCCDPFNDKALRASRGASFRVPIGVGEWDHVRQFAIANELKLYAGDPQPEMGFGDNFSSPMAQRDVDGELKFPVVDDGQGLCLVLGSEGQGLSGYVTKDCVPIGIPMPGDFESLNVAVAGGILMFLLR